MPKIRNKTRARVLKLVVLIGASAIFMVPTYLIRERVLDTRALGFREIGMREAKEGHYKEGLQNLRKYFKRIGFHSGDRAVYQYALCRINIELPNGKHIHHAMSLLWWAMGNNPEESEAGHLLLEIQLMIGWNVEALQLAEKLLTKDAKDIFVLRAKSVAIRRRGAQSDLLESLETIKIVTEKLDADDIIAHEFQMSLMYQLNSLNVTGFRDDVLIEHAITLVDQNPGDIRYRMIESQTYLILSHNNAETGDKFHEIALSKYRDLAQDAISDPLVATKLLADLEHAGLYESAMEVAENMDPEKSPVRIHRWLAERWWEAGDHNKVIRRFYRKNRFTTIAENDVQIQAMVVMSLYAINRDSESVYLRKLMSQRANDRKTRIWLAFFEAIESSGPSPEVQIIRVARNALEEDKGNPYFSYWLARLLVEAGEFQEAKSLLQFVVRKRPAWGAARLTMLRLGLRMGELEPTREILSEIRKISEHRTNNDELLSLYIDVLANLGRENSTYRMEAISQIRKCLSVSNIVVDGPDVKVNGVVVGKISKGESGENLRVSWNENCTPAAAQEVVRHVAYSNPREDLGEVMQEFVFELSDGDTDKISLVNKVINIIPISVEASSSKAGYENRTPELRDKISNQNKSEGRGEHQEENTRQNIISNTPPVLKMSSILPTYVFNTSLMVIDPIATVKDLDSNDFDRGYLAVGVSKPNKIGGKIRIVGGVGQKFLFDLIKINRRENLGLDQELKEKQKLLYPNSTQVVLTLLEEESPQKALEILNLHLRMNPSATIEGRLAKARVLEKFSAEDAYNELVELSRHHPDSVRVMKEVLNSKVVWENARFMKDSDWMEPNLISDAIARLKEVSPNQGYGWRIGEARRLLAKSSTQNDLAEAARILNFVIDHSPDRVEPRVLLAAAQQQMGNNLEARSNLRWVNEKKPGDLGVYLALAQLEIDLGNNIGARDLMEEVVKSTEQMTKEQIPPAIDMAKNCLKVQELDRFLRRLYNTEKLSKKGTLVLAQLQENIGNMEFAEQLYEELIKAPDLIIVRQAALFYHRKKDRQRASDILNLLSEIDADDHRRVLVRAEFFHLIGDLIKARSLYKSAIELNRKSVKAWIGLLLVNLEPLDQKLFSDALASVRLAVKTLPDNDHLFSVQQNMERIEILNKNTKTNPIYLKIALAGVIDQSIARSLSQIIEYLENPSSEKMEQYFRLVRISEEWTGNLVTQKLIGELLMQAGAYSDASVLLSSAMNRFSDDTEIARMATYAQFMCGQWDEVENSAADWQERTAGRRVGPDLFLASVLAVKELFPQAIEVLEFHIVAIEKNPVAFQDAIGVWAQSLIFLGQIENAYEFLVKYISLHHEFRTIWIDLAGKSLPAQYAWDWLKKIEGYIAPENQEEKRDLAEGYLEAWRRTDDSRFRDRAEKIIQDVIAAGPTDQSVWLLMRAFLMHGSKNEIKAEILYRNAVKLNPGLHRAANNLAMLLSRRGTELDYALELAESAVREVPSNPNYYDTLAAVHGARGEQKEAESAIKVAIRLDPENAAWLLRQAEIRIAEKDSIGARKILDQIESLDPKRSEQAQKLRDLLK